MGRVVSIHEYELKPGTNIEQFEQVLRDAEARGLLQLPGLVAHYFVKGAKGVRRGGYAAVWIYESREAWEHIWGTPEHPRLPEEYPDTWRGLGARTSRPLPEGPLGCDQLHRLRRVGRFDAA